MKVVNDTPLPSQVFLWRDRDARRYCSIFVKATCRLSDGKLGEAQEPLVMADVLGENGVVARPADVVPTRTGTSIVFRASVCAPRGRVATEIHARARIGTVERRLVAFGRRKWEKRGGEHIPSPPDPFERVSATMNQAFGGGPPGAFTANPAGVGYVATDEERPAGKLLPALEDPDARLRTPEDRPHPVALDAIPAAFSPRTQLAGTYDESWKRERAPLPPDDFDARYFDVAQPSLVARPYLRGREPIELEGLHPDGAVASSVPRPPVRIDVGSAREVACIDLIVIEPEADKVALTFRRTYEVTPLGIALPTVSIILLEGLSASRRYA